MNNYQNCNLQTENVSWKFLLLSNRILTRNSARNKHLTIWVTCQQQSFMKTRCAKMWRKGKVTAKGQKTQTKIDSVPTDEDKFTRVIV